MDMSENKKHTTEERQIFGGRAIVSKEIKSHSNDPFVVKKVEEAKAFFKRAGFPKVK
jgi:hypothetical protein